MPLLALQVVLDVLVPNILKFRDQTGLKTKLLLSVWSESRRFGHLSVSRI